MNDEFDISRIPDHVLHNAVQNTLSSQGLVSITGGYKFRCPICGDSKKNKNLKRGYVLYNDGKWVYVCHNQCGNMGFIIFLKEFHPQLYREVLFYGFKNQEERVEVKLTRIQKTYKANELYEFKEGELLDLYADHPLSKKGLQYCLTRKIRKEVYNEWFVCIENEKFKDRDQYGRFIMNDKGYPKGNEYKNRLIIPYYRFGGKWTQFDARALDNSTLRYRNLEGADREPYNIDWIDTSKPFFLLEGSIDSTFIRNAMGYGGTKHLIKFIEEYPHLKENIHNGVSILDNDEAGYDELVTSIRMGLKWFNWSNISPSEKYKFKEDGSPRKIKDINDAVLYSDAFELDDEGYITYESLEKFIEYPSEINVNMLYGDREKMRKYKFKKIFNDAKIKREKDNDITFNL